MEIGDGDACDSKEERVLDALEAMESPLQLPERSLLQGGGQHLLSGNKL